MLIKIALADDHPIVVNGLITMLSEYSDIQLFGTYADGDALLAGLKLAQPDVLLLDIQMPGKQGDELASILHKIYPELKIIVLTNFDSVFYIQQMLQRGVKGYLLKTTDKEVLIAAIKAVYNGGEFIDDVFKSKLRHAKHKAAGSIKLSFTSREKEVLQYIVNGLTNPEIAEKIHLSVHTVENYRDSILLKMDVSNTAALVKKAIQLGLAVWE
ncbi:MAG: response regulator transcription factor [Flavipsychrobacter sp.]|nr:response regulator transcription factor [Flavipsychrobacter sp.]